MRRRGALLLGITVLLAVATTAAWFYWQHQPEARVRGLAAVLASAPVDYAIAAGHDLAVARPLRQFFYMPFEHSESLAMQNRGVALMEPLDADTLRWAVLHRDIIKRFGRFPHRNAALGRQTTQAEQEFLASGGFAG